jgi:hypothetical protein
VCTCMSVYHARACVYTCPCVHGCTVCVYILCVCVHVGVYVWVYICVCICTGRVFIRIERVIKSVEAGAPLTWPSSLAWMIPHTGSGVCWLDLNPGSLLTRCISQFHIIVTNTRQKQFEGGKIYLRQTGRVQRQGLSPGHPQ